MRDINLIPPDILQARRISSRLRLWIVLNLAVVGILILATAVTLWSVRSERAKAGDLDSRMAQLRQWTEHLDRLRAERSLLNEEADALASFVDRYPNHHRIRTLTEAMADKGWLNRIEMTRSVGRPKDGENSGMLLLEGHAGSYKHLAEWMRDLGALEWIAGVDLRRSQQAQAEGLDVVQFELECTLSSKSPRR